MSTTTFDFTTLTQRALQAAIKYHRLKAEELWSLVSKEMRRHETTETTEADDREFRRLLSDHIEHSDLFTAALREARARKKSTT